MSLSRLIIKASLKSLDRNAFKYSYKSLILLFAVFVCLYLGIIQADRYASTAKIVVSQLNNLESNNINLSSIISGNTSKTDDSAIIVEYIKSKEMMNYLDEKLDLKKMFSRSEADLLSKLSQNSDEDDLYDFYLSFLKLRVSSDSPIINIEMQGFIPEDSEKILELIIKQSEQFINKISKTTARQQLDFIRQEVAISEEKIITAQEDLQKIQEKFNAPDPTAEVTSVVSRVSDLEQQLSQKEIELNQLMAYMSPLSVKVRNLRREIEVIESEIEKQKKRVIKKNDITDIENVNMMFEYKNMERKLEFAIEAHRAALSAQEKVRTTSAQNLKKLVVITGPSTEINASYPRRVYNISLFLFCLGLIYYIIKATYSAVMTHKSIN
ncbi:MAG: hypothetical protein SFT90_04695 [Rickettsiales bacterium]|nr:hypothetical protein [Rickettsiales bacterium]